METKRTKVEWKVIHRSSHTNFQSFDIQMNGCTYEQMNFNEKVIESAPDLLDALVELVKKYEFNLNQSQKKNLHLDEEYNNAINAINKANGK